MTYYINVFKIVSGTMHVRLVSIALSLALVELKCILPYEPNYISLNAILLYSILNTS